MSDFDDTTWRAAGRATPLAISALSRARGEINSITARLNDLNAQRTKALDALDPAAETAKLMPSLHALQTSDLPRLDAAIGNLIEQRQTLAPIIAELVGDWKPPAKDATP